MLAEEMKSLEADERFQHLFQSHYGNVHAYCSRRIGHSDADDVAAEVFATTLPDSPEVEVVDRAIDEAVTNALRRLRASDREILMLAAWEELSAAEIAGALSISTPAAEQRLHRAKARFATALDHVSGRSRPGAGGGEH